MCVLFCVTLNPIIECTQKGNTVHKSLWVITTTLLILVLSACGNASTDSDTSNTGTNSETESVEVVFGSDTYLVETVGNWSLLAGNLSNVDMTLQYLPTPDFGMSPEETISTLSSTSIDELALTEANGQQLYVQSDADNQPSRIYAVYNGETVLQFNVITISSAENIDASLQEALQILSSAQLQ